MCKEDVRIKRQTATNTNLAQTVNGGFVRALTANPERVAIVWGFASGGIFGSGATSYVLRTGGSVTSPVLSVLASSKPSDVLTIEQLGVFLTSELWVFTNDAGQAIVSVTEVFFTQPMNVL